MADRQQTKQRRTFPRRGGSFQAKRAEACKLAFPGLGSCDDGDVSPGMCTFAHLEYAAWQSLPPKPFQRRGQKKQHAPVLSTLNPPGSEYGVWRPHRWGSRCLNAHPGGSSTPVAHDDAHPATREVCPRRRIQRHHVLLSCQKTAPECCSRDVWFLHA
jgi:hypothetical protein